MNAFRYGMRYWKKRLPCAILCQLMGFVGLGVGLLLPIIGAMFIDSVLNFSGEYNDGLFSFLLRFGEPGSWQLYFVLVAVFLMFELVREVLIYFRNILFQRNGFLMENELRDATYKKLGQLDSSTVSSYNTGDLFTTLLSDIVQEKEMYSRILLVIGDGIFVMTLACIVLVLNSAYMLILPAVIAPVLAVGMYFYLRKAKKISKRIRDCDADLNLRVQENINAVRLVRSFANEDFEKQKFETANRNFRDAYCEQIRMASRYGLLFNIIRQFTYIAAVAVGTIMVFRGHFGVGVMTACVSYVLLLMDWITTLSNQIYMFQFGMVSSERIMNFLERETKIPESPNPKSICEDPNITVDHLTIIDDGQVLVKDVSLDVPFGKKVGIMGGTGSGKSVLLKSLVRMYDASDGSVKINGKDIREYDLNALRREYAYVFQDVFLFSETVEANIAFYAPDVDPDAIHRVAKYAQANSFIHALPQGYGTIIGERGVGLSGGQKQRISIARALLKNAPVLVLDDASSALDATTERILMQDIKNNYPNRTILIAAHRVSSIMDCDEILYMQDGAIVERGTFDELIQKNGLFAEIYRMQTEEDDDDDADISDSVALLNAGKED